MCKIARHFLTINKEDLKTSHNFFGPLSEAYIIHHIRVWASIQGNALSPMALNGLTMVNDSSVRLST